MGLLVGGYEAKSATPIEGNCANLGLYLTECTKFKCSMSNPKVPSLNIEQEILGFDEDGKCVHVQKMSENQVVACSYAEYSRKYIAIRMEQNKDKISGSVDDRQEELEKRLMEDIFRTECSIFEKDIEDSHRGVL